MPRLNGGSNYDSLKVAILVFCVSALSERGGRLVDSGLRPHVGKASFQSFNQNKAKNI